jgi:carboxyl-terminal processing protease
MNPLKHLTFIKWFLFISILLGTISCKEDKDDTIINTIPNSVRNINKFVYDYMNLGYFWNTEMPKIDYRLESDSKQYFYKLLKNPDDKWSFITEDIEALRAYFQGIVKSKGYSIQPYYFKEGSNQVVVFVEYVYRNSPAEAAGIKRGDMLYKINGQVINDQNYQQLLSLDNMTITFGDVTSNGEIIALEPQVSISAVVLQTHPIVATSITEIDNNKIGYLAYTAFRSNYDTALVNIFREFKTAGVTDLVLDLRYNGGGDVSTALLLASLIAPESSVGDVLIREKWNNNLRRYNEDLKIPAHAQNLNLSRLFVLTTGNTASASEMIIYGLAPHMEVIQIGETTLGKYYGSVTISDPNEKHLWAIQPIVMRSENKTNSINYQQGLPPDKLMEDNVYNAQLGESDEHFLAQAVSKITSGVYLTTSLKSATEESFRIKGFKDRQDPLRNTMLVEIPEIEIPITD